MLDAGQVNDRSVDDILAQVKQIVGDLPVYLTFDIDCLDPSAAPSTGTPVIGGLTSDRALKLVRGLQPLNIVGMDIVEVAPAYDQAQITALAAATLALEMLYIQGAKRDGEGGVLDDHWDNASTLRGGTRRGTCVTSASAPTVANDLVCLLSSVPRAAAPFARG